MADETRNATTLQAAGGWTSESNFTGAHDGACMGATAKDALSGEFSFNFSVIAGTINGIEVMIHHAVGDTNDWINVELKDSTSTWRLLSVAVIGSAGTCATAVDRTVGGPTNLWGGTWSDTHIKSTNFRIRVTAMASGKSGGAWNADYCTVKVYYTAGAIDKDMADVGSGSDVFAKTITLLSKAFVDAGAGGDVLTNPYRAMGFADTLDGVDAFATLYREMGFDDSGAGADVFGAQSLLTPKGFADTVGGSDVFTLMRLLDIVDSGAGADVISLTRPMYFSDVGGGVEVFSIPFKELPVADTALGTDVFTTPFRAMGFVDAGSGTDVFTVFLFIEFSDSALGTDAFTVPWKGITKFFVDSGLGSEVFVTPYREMGFQDTASGLDIFELLRFLAFVDSASGADAFSLLAMMGFSDVGSGADIFAIPFRAMGFADVGSGTEVFFLLAEMGFTDVGAGDDVFTKSLIGLIVTKIIVTTMT